MNVILFILTCTVLCVLHVLQCNIIQHMCMRACVRACVCPSTLFIACTSGILKIRRKINIGILFVDYRQRMPEAVAFKPAVLE